jgi:hypothetical protein
MNDLPPGTAREEDWRVKFFRPFAGRGTYGGFVGRCSRAALTHPVRSGGQPDASIEQDLGFVLPCGKSGSSSMSSASHPSLADSRRGRRRALGVDSRREYRENVML